MPEWVTKVAQAILDNWSIGTYSQFCDEVDFDSATVGEVAELIWREYQAAQQSVQADGLRAGQIFGDSDVWQAQQEDSNHI